MTQTLKFTNVGFEELKKELELKQEELRQLGQYKNQAAENEGDAWHDNFAFEQTEIKERGLIYEINQLKHQIETAELIETDPNEDESVIKVGSKIRVYMEYSDGDGEEDTFILTGGQGKIDENKVSVNSPIGKCVLGKKMDMKGIIELMKISLKLKF